MIKLYSNFSDLTTSVFSKLKGNKKASRPVPFSEQSVKLLLFDFLFSIFFIAFLF